MISRPEALKLLKSIVKDEAKLSHSVHVAEMMENIAGQFHRHPETWYLTGLLHDIDIPSIGDDWSQHGIKAQKILAGLLPDQALRAIMAHDPNPGKKSESKFTKSLIFADVVDNLSRKVSMDELREAMQTMNFDELKMKLPNDLYHLQVIANFVQQWPEVRI
jgi:predicted hydrolase (HD superfamily)